MERALSQVAGPRLTVTVVVVDVVVVVASHHRGPAFDACRWLMDELKKIGNSTGLILPKELLARLGLRVVAHRYHFRPRVAERVEAGSVLVNDVVINGGMPEAPFGGIKQSGFGRVMSEESLREMCDVRHVNSERMTMPGDPFWFPYTEKSYNVFKKGMRVLFGGGSLTDRIKGLF